MARKKPETSYRFSIPDGGTATTRTNEDGTVIRTFVRPSIKLNTTYIKPGKDGFTLNVTPERVDGWLKNFAAMKAKGRSVKATKDHIQGADGVLGDVIGMQLSDGWLETTHEIRGEDAIAVAEANKDVSIEIKDNFKETDGTIYPGESIVAVTYTPQPVVTGIAASVDDPPTYILSGSMNMAMDKTAHFKAIEKMMGLAPGSVNEENCTEHLCNHMAKMGRYMSLEAENADLKTKLESATKQLSLGTTPTVDKRYLSLAARNGELALENAVNAKILTPAAAEAVKLLAIGDRSKGEYSPIMLSLPDNDSESLITKLVGIIKDNNPIGTGDATKGAHHLALSRQIPDADAPKGPQISGWEKMFPGQVAPLTKTA